MHTWIYKSQRHKFTYIYLSKKDDFEIVPEDIRPYLGDLKFVMQLDLCLKPQLANADIKKVRAALNEQGFYLQIPPTDFKVFD